MTGIDKAVFESLGARGDSESAYGFVMTTCCERVGVLDEVLQDLYFNHEDLGQVARLDVGADCPFCGAPTWNLTALFDADHVPDHWRCAVSGAAPPGRRRVPST